MLNRSLLYGISIIFIIAVGIIIWVLTSSENDNIETQPSMITPSITETKGGEISVTSTRMEITSNAFEHNQGIPSKYTCDGENISPPLRFSEVPEDTKSLALIVDDPDAPSGDFVHWVVFNMPAGTAGIGENSSPAGVQGTTDFGGTGWGGPCPPSGSHRYYFKLFALDTELDIDSSATKAELETAMTGHILDRAELVGLYQRQ